MTRQDIRLLVRQNLAQENVNASFFFDSDINLYINEGIKEACIKGKVYLVHTSLNITTGVATYNLPWQVLGIKSLARDDGTPIPQIDVTNKGMIYQFSTTIPGGYYLNSVPIDGTLTTWQANFAYSVWAATPSTTSYVIPTSPNDYFYECTTAGTSGPTQPTWPTSPGATYNDNGVMWTTREMVGGLYQITLNVTPNYVPAPVYDLWYQGMDNMLATDTQSPRFPIELHRAIVSYATYKCAEMMRQKAMSVAYLTEYCNLLGLTPPTVGA
jgi:hypothetical protein